HHETPLGALTVRPSGRGSRRARPIGRRSGSLPRISEPLRTGPPSGPISKACLPRGAHESLRSRRCPPGNRGGRSPGRHPGEAAPPARSFPPEARPASALRRGPPTSPPRRAPARSRARKNPPRCPSPRRMSRRRTETGKHEEARPCASGDLFLLDEIAERVDGGERLDADLFVLNFDPEFLFEPQNELERIDRIEPQALAEQRRIVLNRCWIDVELQPADDQVFDLSRQIFPGHQISLEFGL